MSWHSPIARAGHVGLLRPRTPQQPRLGRRSFLGLPPVGVLMYRPSGCRLVRAYSPRRGGS
eukprot:3897-Pyramimonas_sp.AAC.1